MDKSYLLSAILPLLSATLAVTFFFLWQRKKDSLHVLNWSLTYLCAVIGSSLDFARVFIESPAALSFTANVFLVGVAFFAVRGSIIRYTGKPSDRLLIPFTACLVAGGLWFGFVNPSIFGRGMVSSGGSAIMFVIGAGTILRRKEIDKLDRLMAVSFLLTSATLIARLLASYIYEGPIAAEKEVAGSLWIVSFKVFAILSWFAIAILFLLRITSDLMKELAAQSVTDPLTGIANRRGFFAAAEAVAPKTSHSRPSTLLILDIDHFKRVNDTFGHNAGDKVIQSLATLLRKQAELHGGIVGRLGGEEFVALLPDTDLPSGRLFAEGIRTAFATCKHDEVPWSHDVTTSIGLAVSTGGEDVTSIVERADAALYQAKREGRNRVQIAFDDDSSPVELPNEGLGAQHRRRGPRAA